MLLFALCQLAPFGEPSGPIASGSRHIHRSRKGGLDFESPAGELHTIAEHAQPRGNSLAMVALDLDDAVLERAAGAAQALELHQASIEAGAPLRKATDHGYRLAPAVTSLAEDPHDAVV